MSLRERIDANPGWATVIFGVVAGITALAMALDALGFIHAYITLVVAMATGN